MVLTPICSDTEIFPYRTSRYQLLRDRNSPILIFLKHGCVPIAKSADTELSDTYWFSDTVPDSVTVSVSASVSVHYFVFDTASLLYSATVVAFM